MDKITIWIKQHQLAAFFLITFGISFGLGFSYDAVINQGKGFLSPLVATASCGPALAAIIVSRVCSRKTVTRSTGAAWVRFLVALITAVLVFLANNSLTNQAPFSPNMLVFILVFSIPVAYVLSAAYSPVSSVRYDLKSVFKIRQILSWLGLSLVLVAALNVLSILVSNWLGRQSVQLADLSFTGWTLIKMVGVTFFYQLFFFNLTGEEIGWRGFALPRLQTQMTPLTANLVLTLIWAMWHVFYWQAGGEPIFSGQFWIQSLFRLFPATVLINWFYNRSQGSILVAGVTHAWANTVMQYMPQIDWPVHTAILYAFAMTVILVDQMWRRLPASHPAGHLGFNQQETA